MFYCMACEFEKDNPENPRSTTHPKVAIKVRPLAAEMQAIE